MKINIYQPCFTKKHAHIKNNTLAGRHNVDIWWKEYENTQKKDLEANAHLRNNSGHSFAWKFLSSISIDWKICRK